MDKHFLNEKDVRKNIPAMMALIDFYHINVQGYDVKCIIPYSQPLHSFLLHIAQLEMESNGKIVHLDEKGEAQNYTGGVVFGDVGSNCQHSFFQLVHQGRVVPVEFIVFANNTMDSRTQNHPISHHEELMMNYFAQVKCLALGRTADEVKTQFPTMPESVARQNVFEGNRPNSSLLFPCLTSEALGQLFSIYENKVAAEGFLSGINSFDQYGVELGKKLCTGLREKLKSVQNHAEKVDAFSSDPIVGMSFKYFFENHTPIGK